MTVESASPFVQFGQLQSHTDDPRWLRFLPVAVGCEHKSIIRSSLDSWIRAVPAVLIILQPHQILAGISGNQIFVLPDPRDPVSIEL
jgi:hypothetical protein